ncbi:MAG: response regulator [Verrucomicrobiae bacterium]|nr:response regulator [Verrucomicrobiae bacterium]
MAAISLVNDDELQCSQIRDAVASLGAHQIVSESRTGQEALFMLASTRTDIAFVRVNLPDMAGLDLVASLAQRKPNLQFVLTLEGDERPDVWQRILQLGLRNVITPPLDAESIRQAIEQCLQAVPAPGQGHQPVAGNSFLVAVASARGGVGKTLVASNLAACLAQWNPNVSLVDFSGQPNDFSVMLDAVPRNTIADLLNAGEQVDAEFLETLMAEHPLGLRFLASPSQEFDIAELTKPLARDVAANLRQISEYVVIDTGRPDAPATEAALAECDMAFVLTTRDVVRLLATQRFIKRLGEWDVPPDRIKVLVNSAEVGAEISDGEIESILEHPVAAYLPSNPEPATYSINSGKPLTISDPKQPLAVVLTKLAELTFNRWSDEKHKAPEKKTSGRIAKPMTGPVSGRGMGRPGMR